MSGLVPGSYPPTIVPYCQRCDQPVERLTFDPISSPYYIGIHAQCCGQTSSVRMPVEEMFRLKRTNEKFYIIVGKHRTQGLRKQARR